MATSKADPAGMTSKADPIGAMRQKASCYPDVTEGDACSQSSFKVGKKSFLFVGVQGDRYKVMFKLEKSIPQVAKLAEKDPDSYAIGSTGWATIRFTAEKPLAKKLWEKWLDESYGLNRVIKAPMKKAKKRKVTKKSVTKKKTKKRTKKKLARKTKKS